MNTVQAKGTKRLGRPLSFDRAHALDCAILLFWAHGYEATSVADLTKAMGITPPSLYAAFGDKKALFLEAVALYCSRSPFAENPIVTAKTAGEAAKQMLNGAADHFTGKDTPHGCLLASAAIVCSAAAEDVRKALANIRQQTELHLRDKILADIASGSLPDDTDADLLAAYVLAMIQGMATLARDGASRERLLSLAGAMMHSWPS